MNEQVQLSLEMVAQSLKMLAALSDPGFIKTRSEIELLERRTDLIELLNHLQSVIDDEGANNEH